MHMQTLMLQIPSQHHPLSWGCADHPLSSYPIAFSLYHKYKNVRSNNSLIEIILENGKSEYKLPLWKI